MPPPWTWRKSTHSTGNGQCIELGTHPDAITWRKSSRSTGNGVCVELGTNPTTPAIAIRDSKAGATAPILTFAPAPAAAFLTAAKTNRFSH
ncbi:DUF397 domain-containing protein [Actinokineospora inagensis]|uniref:DUF397 domain-containing protein n=1 Tax=Actinokineospora inagensis TaxID=103730 RepID=UPI000402562A|nr:DUF397 domain-containing protein [Actinokineospora inagensis]